MYLFFLNKGSSEDTKGKCGFGGSSDTNNGETTATGGINKDRDYQTYSPHYQLHLKAYFAAVEATFQFLIDPGITLVVSDWTSLLSVQ